MRLTGRLYAVLILLCLWAAPPSGASAGDWSQAHGFASVDAIIDAPTRKDDRFVDASIDSDDAKGFAGLKQAHVNPVYASFRHAPEQGGAARTRADWLACRPRAPPAPRV